MTLGCILLGLVLAFLLGCLVALGLRTLPEQKSAKHQDPELQNSSGPWR